MKPVATHTHQYHHIYEGTWHFGGKEAIFKYLFFKYPHTTSRKQMLPLPRALLLIHFYFFFLMSCIFVVERVVIWYNKKYNAMSGGSRFVKTNVCCQVEFNEVKKYHSYTLKWKLRKIYWGRLKPLLKAWRTFFSCAFASLLYSSFFLPFPFHSVCILCACRSECVCAAGAGEKIWEKGFFFLC